MSFDVLIVGNGIVGSLTAVMINKNLPKIKIGLIGPSNRPGSASIAAGAMLNVFGEIDYSTGEEDKYIKRKLDIGLKGVSKWLNFLEENNNDKSIKVADKTIIYCQKNGTELEKGCFKAIKKASTNYGVLSSDPKNLLKAKELMNIGKNASFIEIKNEPAISTPEIFRWIDNTISDNDNLQNINDKAVKIESNADGNIIYTEKSIYKTKRLIIANGAFFSKLAKDFKSISVPIFYGVGTALDISLEDNKKSIVPERCVVRTPNRGSTCGIHVVPRGKNRFYVGAGNYLSHSEAKGNRFATVKYLMKCFETDFSNDVQKSSIQTCLGYRPISFDGKPMIGALEEYPNVYVATGTKRDGLTYAPVIAENILDWLNEKKPSGDFLDWHPERKPISYGDVSYSIKAYIDNKLAGLLEHKDIEMNDVKRVTDELHDEAIRFHNNIHKKFNLNNNFGIHPEILNIF